jgi:hypothetical protein
MSEKITSAMQQAESVDIVWPDGTQISFPYLWLREK